MSDKPNSAQGITHTPAGLSIKQWAEQAGIAFSTYYLIAPNLRPRHARIGRRVIIIESAKAWLERMAIAGQVACRLTPPPRDEQNRRTSRGDAGPKRTRSTARRFSRADA